MLTGSAAYRPVEKTIGILLGGKDAGFCGALTLERAKILHASLGRAITAAETKEGQLPS